MIGFLASYFRSNGKNLTLCENLSKAGKMTLCY